MFGIVRPACAQVLTSTSNGVLNAIIPFGTLLPGSSNTPSTVQVQFRIRSSSNQGYNVRASLNSFTVTPSSPASGGATISPSDIAVAITFVDTSGSGVQQPRVDTIAYGFNYNPGGVTASNGIASFTGVASGQATLADLNATKILSGPRIASSQNSSSTTNFIMVTITFGVLREYFTPASLTAVVGLTMSDGQ
jgi:hypothetical protein